MQAGARWPHPSFRVHEVSADEAFFPRNFIKPINPALTLCCYHFSPQSFSSAAPRWLSWCRALLGLAQHRLCLQDELERNCDCVYRVVLIFKTPSICLRGFLRVLDSCRLWQVPSEHSAPTQIPGGGFAMGSEQRAARSTVCQASKR